MPGMNAFIRVRPCKRAKGDRPAEVSVLKHEPRIGNTITTPTTPAGVSFPAVFGPESSQRDVFVTCGLPMLEGALEGVNSLLFAYGQTGSGKTFSMLGADGGSNPLALDGIVPQMRVALPTRAFSPIAGARHSMTQFRRPSRRCWSTPVELSRSWWVGLPACRSSEILRRFSQLEKQSSGAVKCKLMASFIEIADERIYDLLRTGSDNTPLKVRGNDMAQGRALHGATIERVSTAPELSSMIERALDRRAVGSTDKARRAPTSAPTVRNAPRNAHARKCERSHGTDAHLSHPLIPRSGRTQDLLKLVTWAAAAHRTSTRADRTRY